ncbi:hypothetical protein QBC38DRAFT_492418 [Podospora fimiseda]|uniref:Uncharacterized protein n=1 Tax=Podospora fimiseda TaxID=252190 RepID=A0AAN6YNI4_9PEZI|nr:hypothetical protein QBC38DRAFT_492418 [Podospora fimiseda]
MPSQRSDHSRSSSSSFWICHDGGHSQEIESRRISVHHLNSLLTTIFPSGSYEVDIDQNVYKIRAPRQISDMEIRRSSFSGRC